MTFYGESVELDWAEPITAAVVTDYGQAMRYRDGSDTFSSGASILCSFYGYSYLESPTQDVAAALVIILGDATSGTLQVAVGMDPTWSYDDPSYATQNLGTHALTGASELVLPVPGFDVAAHYNYDALFTALLEVNAGTVEVVQVKLRLWPPGGISGAWVPGPDVTDEAPVGISGVSVLGVGHSTASIEDAFAAAVADWNTSPATMTETISSYTYAGESYRGVTVAGISQGEAGGSGPVYQVVVDAARIWVTTTQAGALIDFLPGLDPYRHPDEVAGEPGSLARDAGGDPATWAFSGWTRGITASGIGEDENGLVDFLAGDTIPPGGTILVRGSPRWEFDTPYLPDPPTGGVQAVAGDTTLTLPSVSQFSIRLGVQNWYERPLSFFPQFAVRIPSALRAVTLATGYYVWDPEAVTAIEIPMRIRQRGDGLGMGAPRVRGTASRQRSTRVRGHH